MARSLCHFNDWHKRYDIFAKYNPNVIRDFSSRGSGSHEKIDGRQATEKENEAT